jgi:trans-2,3-dihydro-3-hydroxyanthranilate isomerase
MMMTQIHLVKAFTKDPAAGNPAGVVRDARGLSDEQMLFIARTLGFSESAFVFPSDKADFKVRFFAAKQEVDFCGHATVATFHSLAEQGAIKILGEQTTVKQETKSGVFPVTCHQDGKIMMTQGDPQFGEIETDKSLIAQLLNLSEHDFSDLPLQIVSTASPKLIVPLVSLQALRKVKPDLDAITKYIQEHTARGLYIFATETPSGKGDFAARFFNPAIGIDEDPATGVAAGPLGCYADKYIFKDSKKQFVIEQGFDMGMSSTIYIDLTDGVLVGGYAAAFGKKEVEA